MLPHINRRHYALKAEKNVVVNFISRCTSWTQVHTHELAHAHKYTVTTLTAQDTNTSSTNRTKPSNSPCKLFHECFLPCTSPPLSLTLPRSVHNTSCLYQHITVNGVITALHYLVMAPLSHLLVSTPRPGL